MEIKFKVWLENEGAVVAGEGRVRLLGLIEQHGSIQKAARENGMSYRHAWGALRKMEKRSGLKWVETRAGGKAGGGARLTEPARDFAARYARFNEGLVETIRQKFQEAFREESSPGKRKKPRADR